MVRGFDFYIPSVKWLGWGQFLRKERNGKLYDFRCSELGKLY